MSCSDLTRMHGYQDISSRNGCQMKCPILLQLESMDTFWSTSLVPVSEQSTGRSHFVNASSQWETTLHCNISHWLGAYTKWSLTGQNDKDGLTVYPVVSFKKVPGGRFNIKMSYYKYGKSHCGDKTILQTSYLHNGISYTGKMTSLYWIRAQAPIFIDLFIFKAILIFRHLPNKFIPRSYNWSVNELVRQVFGKKYLKHSTDAMSSWSS